MARTNGKSYSDIDHLAKLGTHSYHNRGSSVRMLQGKVQKTQRGRSFQPASEENRDVTQSLTTTSRKGKKYRNYINCSIVGAAPVRKERIRKKAPVYHGKMVAGRKFIKDSRTGDLYPSDEIFSTIVDLRSSTTTTDSETVTIEINGESHSINPSEVYPV